MNGRSLEDRGQLSSPAHIESPRMSHFLSARVFWRIGRMDLVKGMPGGLLVTMIPRLGQRSFFGNVAAQSAPELFCVVRIDPSVVSSA